MNIKEIEGIGPTFGEKLETAGVNTVEKLLEKGATPTGRKELAETTGISIDKILDWTNMADLTRVNGVGGEFAELLKATGVDTIKELRTRNAANLHEALVKTNEEKKLTRVVPGLEKVTDFIEQAKTIDPKITY